MEVSYSALDAEAGLSYDTTVRVSVHPAHYYPDFVAVTLLWLASSHIFHGVDEFNRFRDDFEDRPEERYQHHGRMALGVRFHGKGHEEIVLAGQTGRETPPLGHCARVAGNPYGLRKAPPTCARPSSC